jgi:eukaryotic-like serine/threonine-protein kinase
MSACPGEDLLLGLLNERLDGSELAEMVVHVEACPRCQQHLEELTRGHGWKSTLEDVAGDSSSDDERCAQRTAQLEGDATFDVIDAAPINRTSDDTGQCGGSTEPMQPVDHRTGTLTQGESADDRSRGNHEKPRRERPKVPGYEIMARLGEGGMGVVYKARQLGLNRLVALKMIRGGIQARLDHFVRFSIEAEAVARLRHPNILQIFDIGEVEGLPFVSLELLEGGSLADRLAGTPQPGRPSAELLATLALAIDEAHRAGIVHRDLKPTNVLFTEDGIPKITDFGLAKRIDSNDHQTDTGQVMGSPSYMAPEQARGHSKDIGPVADVYALGAILYEMLTGRPPFRGETPIETVRQVIDDDPVPPSSLVPRLPKDLETICLKCLIKESNKRYDSARALADDLGRYLRGEPIKARPTPIWERGAKWSRRRPLKAAGSVLAACLLAGAIAVVFVHEQTIISRQTAGLILLEKTDLAGSQGELQQALSELSEFAPVLNNEKRLTPLAIRIANKRDQISDRLAAFQSEQAKRDQLQAERARFQKFRASRNEAQLYAAHLMVLAPAEHKKTLRATALAGLAVYGQRPQASTTAWSLVQPIAAGLEPAEVAEVKEGCYDLLLILSEAADPADGLAILDRAARLRPEPTTAYHLLRAFCLARVNDESGKAREDQLARDKKPVTAFDHLLIGREQFARGQRLGRGQLAFREDREAIRSCQAAIRLDPYQLGAHLLLAVVYFNTERFSEARTGLNTCIRTAPELLSLYLFRALIAGEEGNRALLKLKDNPASAAEWQLEAAEHFTAAEDDYRHALDLGPDANFRYVLLVNRGGMYLQAGRLDEALSDLEAAIRLDAKPFNAHAHLAQTHQRQGRLDRAAQALDRAIERQPDRPELFRARAFLVARPHEKGVNQSPHQTPAERARAISDLEQAIRLERKDSPQTADDHAECGRLLFASGQTGEALAAYEAALRIVPDNLKALRLRALALLEQEKFDEVLAATDAFLARGMPSADLLEVRGQARLGRKDFGGAINDYTVALSLTAGSATLLNRRGWAYLFSDAFKLALADFDAAIRLEPGMGHAYSGRGLARVSLGSWRDAIIDAETAVKLASGSQKQRAYFNAARVNALSLKFAAAEVSRRGEAGLTLHRKLRDRAGDLLLRSVRQLNPDQQVAFWRDVVASDPVLRPFLP